MASSYPMLRYGSSGQEVRRLQQALNRAGYSLEVDGGFGEKTRAALMDYQRRAGMTPDGVAGSKTWASLGLQSAQDRLADLEKGYNPSRETQEARRSWEELAARQPGDYTSPYADRMEDLLRQMADSGCTHAVMEVSSHALALDRVCGLAYTIAAFTNLSRDHLDFHGAMEDYAAAKAALFRQCRAAAVNRDDPWTERILRDCACPVYDYGLHGGHLLAEDMDLSPTGVRFTAREGEVSCPVSVSIPGLFTVYNALAALSMARLSGISLPDAAGALAKVPAVPGRMEPVSAPGLGCRIFIDFAHTPEALAKALEALRPMTPGRIIAVFGCGGCRDKGKRPLMGAAAGQYADLTVLTSDNPRTEDPLAIIRDILPGLSGPHLVIPDRREAIFRALDLARPGDTVILCGKGHEITQETGGHRLPMDERQIIAEYINGS